MILEIYDANQNTACPNRVMFDPPSYFTYEQRCYAELLATNCVTHSNYGVMKANFEQVERLRLMHRLDVAKQRRQSDG